MYVPHKPKFNPQYINIDDIVSIGSTITNINTSPGRLLKQRVCENSYFGGRYCTSPANTDF